MLYYFYFLPAVAAILGCVFAIVFRQVILHRSSMIVKKFALSAADWISVDDLRSVTSNNNDVSRILPFIETHIDEFLNHKLGKAMPMIGMFIGEKTVVQLKGVFMKELEELFPVVIDKYLSEASAGTNVSALISKKIASIPDAAFKEKIRASVSKELQWLPLGGLIAGLLIGLIQILILLTINTPEF